MMVVDGEGGGKLPLFSSRSGLLWPLSFSIGAGSCSRCRWVYRRSTRPPYLPVIGKAWTVHRKRRTSLRWFLNQSLLVRRCSYSLIRSKEACETWDALDSDIFKLTCELQLKKFFGKIHELQEFWDSSRSAIHDHEDIAKVEKFKYLRHFLEESASGVITGFA